MEEFEHMVVDEFNEEDFYETIEAPKFVDLTAPDHRPEGDDRYWFCSRVGCDQKHEEFMDSEAIYKKFVLRVMAARSPSVRLRKALYTKDSSVDLNCPNTVPAKPSRSRVSRLAMISSIPHKANGEIRPKEVKVISKTNKNATPKGSKSTVISSVPKKALTERKKQTQSPSAAFRSVQNPRTARIKQYENRVVAKQLVFHSPKKFVKLKRSVELSSSVKKLCNGVRELEIESKRNGLNRPLRTREVKSRVFDSVRSQKRNDEKAKQKVKGKEEPVVSSDPTKAHEANGMESEELLETSKTSNMSGEDLAVVKKSGIDKEKQDHTMEIEDKENALTLECENKEKASNEADVVGDDSAVTKETGLDKAKKHDKNDTNAADVDKESDDKENSSALDNNRKVDQAVSPLLKRKVFIKKETCKTTQKVMATTDKCFNGKTVLANACVKYTKPKLTNPKPFRLRTDERRILKEANTEKKPQCDLAKEEETTNIVGFHGENLVPKHQPVILEKKNTTSKLKAFKETTSTELSRHNAYEITANHKRSTKKQVTSTRTEKKTTVMNGESDEVAIINNNKRSVCSVASGEKRRLVATVPKGPNFHSIHVPKSCCTKRVASQVQ